MGRVVIGTAIGIAFVVAMLFATLRESQVGCEVCVRFGGAEACREAAAADRDQAIAMARNTACAVLASGVTRGMQCNRTQPHRIRCDAD